MTNFVNAAVAENRHVHYIVSSQAGWDKDVHILLLAAWKFARDRHARSVRWNHGGEGCVAEFPSISNRHIACESLNLFRSSTLGSNANP
jgi:hypothetical protein